MVHGHGPSPLSFYSKLKPGNGPALSDFLEYLLNFFYGFDFYFPGEPKKVFHLSWAPQTKSDTIKNKEKYVQINTNTKYFFFKCVHIT